MFKQRRPRPFHHTYMYVDIRKEEFKELENRVRKNCGKDTDCDGCKDNLRGVFTGSVTHLKRRKTGFATACIPLSISSMLVLILILIVICKFLLIV